MSFGAALRPLRHEALPGVVGNKRVARRTRSVDAEVEAGFTDDVGLEVDEAKAVGREGIVGLDERRPGGMLERVPIVQSKTTSTLGIPYVQI